MTDPQPESHFTYRDYLLWKGDERYELIAGKAHSIPTPNRRHQDIVFGLARQLAAAFEGSPSRVYLAPFDVRLPRGLEDDVDIETVVQPDISVICDESKLDEAGCRGAPDLIVEVISPPTAARDRVVKHDLYQLHGVDEYWLVDSDKRTLTIYSRPLNASTFAKPLEVQASGKLKLQKLDIFINFRFSVGD